MIMSYPDMELGRFNGKMEGIVDLTWHFNLCVQVRLHITFKGMKQMMLNYEEKKLCREGVCCGEDPYENEIVCSK